MTNSQFLQPTLTILLLLTLSIVSVVSEYTIIHTPWINTPFMAAGVNNLTFVDTGNHADDVTRTITFPFPVEIYNVTYSYGAVSSNGNLQFLGSSSSGSSWINLAAQVPVPQLGPSLVVFMGDHDTGSMNGAGATDRGIFTGTAGQTPNRVFVIDWKLYPCCAVYSSGLLMHAQTWFYENSTNITVVYSGAPSIVSNYITDSGDLQLISGVDTRIVIGIQADGTAALNYTSFVDGLTDKSRLDYMIGDPIVITIPNPNPPSSSGSSGPTMDDNSSALPSFTVSSFLSVAAAAAALIICTWMQL